MKTLDEQLILNIPQCDPEERLKALQRYMEMYIDMWPRATWTFNDFLLKRFRKIIPGSVEYYRSIATHCFYCNRKYTNEEAFKKTVDHWEPKSGGSTEKFVICCFDCNQRKGNNSPVKLLTQFLRASIQAKSMWGYHGKKLTFIAGQLEIVTHDSIYNTGPTVYYFKR
jgi:hypothetical protein